MRFFLPLCNLKEAPSVLLLLHGFTGGPGAFTHFVKALSVPYTTLTLPGHGLDKENINRITADDLIGAVEGRITELKNRYDRVYIAGWSMGGALALLSERADGVFLFAPAVTEKPVVASEPLRHFTPSVLNPRLAELCDSDDIDIIRYFLETDITPANQMLFGLCQRVRKTVRSYDRPIYAFLGMKDPCINYDEASAYLSSIGSPVIPCPESTHAILYDAASPDVIKQATGIIMKEMS